MNIWQKIIYLGLAIITTLLIFQLEKLEDRVRVLEETIEEQIERAGEIAKTAHTNEIILRNNYVSNDIEISSSKNKIAIKCNLQNSFNSDMELKDEINIFLDKTKDSLIFNNISSTGKNMNDYRNGEQYMFWGDDPDLSYMINIPKKEFHIHTHDGSMVIYKCNF
jgi:sucrose-6-phosphate hydrolase SacC (GH32 family)